jgi:hypothetical protein
MNSSIYTTAAKKGIIGCINYGLYLLFGNITLRNLNSIKHASLLLLLRN